MLSQQTIELLKWVVGVPGAILATVTFPLLARKYHLECKKLQLEILQIEMALSPNKTTEKEPGSFFVWYAKYWVIPCYGVVGIVLPFAFGIKSNFSSWLFGLSIGASLIFFVSGSAVSEQYEKLEARKKHLPPNQSLKPTPTRQGAA